MWLSGWQYRKKITIQGSSGAGTNYPVLLKVGESSGSVGANFHLEGHSANFPSGKNQSGDIRFTSGDGATLLSFWVENVVGTAPNRVAYIWVKVADNLDTNKDVYCYYGNPNTGNASNIKTTFVSGDDFDDNSIDTSIWTEVDTYNRLNETNGRIEISNPHNINEGTWDKYIKTINSLNSGIAIAEAFLDWTVPTTQEAVNGLIVFFDTNNFARIISRSNVAGEYRLQIISNGTVVYNNENTGVSRGKRIRIRYNFSTNQIDFWYQDNNLNWVQMGTTQTYNLGTTCYGMIYGVDATTFNGANLGIFDDFVFRRAVSPEPSFSSAGAEEVSINTAVIRRRLLIK
ncbi:MAG: DUF2341 domain-containing protein [Candidatus Aenigmatarchaeota archaeon]